MKTEEINKLKKILKPLVMECIKESIFEEGVLSALVAEIVTGMGQPIVEQKKKQEFVTPKRDTAAVSKRLQESKNRMLEAIGKDAYGGINVFEGTEPLTRGGSPNSTPSHSPLANIDPNDKGVSIDGLLGAFGDKWNALK